MIYGGQFKSFPPAFSVTGLKIGNTALGISANDLFTAGAVLVAALLLAALFQFTSVGLRLRASAFNASVAQLLGVRVGRMLTLGWALAGLIGALAGVLVTPRRSSTRTAWTRSSCSASPPRSSAAWRARSAPWSAACCSAW